MKREAPRWPLRHTRGLRAIRVCPGPSGHLMSRRCPALSQGGEDLPKHTLVSSRGGAQPGPPQRPRSRLPTHQGAPEPLPPCPLPKLRTGASWLELLTGRPIQSELVPPSVPDGSSRADFSKNGRDATVQVRAARLLRALAQLPSTQEREPGPSGRQHDPGSKGLAWRWPRSMQPVPPARARAPGTAPARPARGTVSVCAISLGS